MPTPAYVPFDSAAISPSTDGNDVPVNALANDNALADELALMGMMAWNPTITYAGGIVIRVDHLKGAFGVRMDFTYIGAGPATGKVHTITHYWSNDTGATWTLRKDTPNSVTAGVLTFSYDGSGNYASAVWS